jgi:hypothetical protein
MNYDDDDDDDDDVIIILRLESEMQNKKYLLHYVSTLLYHSTDFQFLRSSSIPTRTFPSVLFWSRGVFGVDFGHTTNGKYERIRDPNVENTKTR